jgi:hypothetical protein
MSDLVVVNLFPKILLILPLLSACAGVRTAESQSPTCSDPARLEGHADVRAPGVFIAFKPGVEPVAAARRMIQKYHFNAASQYSWGTVFTSDLDLKWIPSIRCEPDVEYLEFNQVVTIGRTVTVDAPRG